MKPLEDYVYPTGGGYWAMTEEYHLHLVNPDELHKLPHGTVLTSISNQRSIVGLDDIDTDTRFGLIAWGFPCTHPGGPGHGPTL